MRRVLCPRAQNWQRALRDAFSLKRTVLTKNSIRSNQTNGEAPSMELPRIYGGGMNRRIKMGYFYDTSRYIVRRKNPYRFTSNLSGFFSALETGNCHKAAFGQFLTHSMHKIHSVPFSRFLELSVTSTFIAQTRLHFPQEMHFSLSHFMRIREK